MNRPQKYANRQTDEMKMLPFDEDVPPSCAGDAAVACIAAVVIFSLILGWIA